MVKSLLVLAAIASFSFANITSINDIPLGSKSSLLEKATISEESEIEGKQVKCMYREGENTAVNDSKYNAIIYCYANDKLFAIRYIAFNKIDDSSAKEMLSQRFGKPFIKLSSGSEAMADSSQDKKDVDRIIEFKVKKNKQGEDYSSFDIIDRTLIRK